MFVIVGGGVAGAVSTMTTPGADDLSAQAVEADLGAPRLEEDPEVVSRAAAAAEPLPLRHGETPAPTPTPAGATTAGESTAAPAKADRKPQPGTPGREATTDQKAATDQLSRARVADDRADRTGPRRARTLAEAPARRRAAAAPVVTTRTDVETRAIPFDTQVVRDPSMPRGTRRVEKRGTAGEKTLRYLVTLTDGRPTSRRLLGSTVTRSPQNRVVAVGSARRVDPDMDCDQILGICLPFGRTAMACLTDGSAGPVVPVAPTADATVDQGEILIAEEDLELLGPDGLEGLEALDAAHLEPATLC